MKPSEISEILTALKDAYPRQAVSVGTARIYSEMLADLDNAKAWAAVRHHMATSPYFPSIAEIRKVATERDAGVETAEAGWLELKRAFSRVGYVGAPSWSSPVMARAVEAMGGWAALCASEEPEGVLRAHFLRVFESFRGSALTAANVATLPALPRPGFPQERPAIDLGELATAKRLTP